MAPKLSETDAYINRAAEFAKPILVHMREMVHRVCPETEEAIKWNFPHFLYKGQPMCYMTAFKQYCVFGFWKASLLNDPDGAVDLNRTESMGHLGKIKTIGDLPSEKTMADLIRQAMKLNEDGIKVPKKTAVKKELQVPGDFLEQLETNPAAKETFENFSYSNKKEYVEWITEAKTEATKEKRMKQALEWMAEGKIRNWKYVK